MPVMNLATCWSPNLLKAETESFEQIMWDSAHVNAIIKTMIEHIDFIAQDPSPQDEEKDGKYINTMVEEETRTRKVNPLYI